ncbi:endonuclease G, mitochondrial-like [Megalobrama amblycephala]|uniref:endonuclease G, mitochondrial-like n=1 Tax=Megalobrama amblycephala TaxID=75352 RepID=UPI0020147514|nr:endonuclease G, mitochondrial-like [Megalobrama amblycephala]XP_048035873.1 endonuclease G, mitochondrial-like [Megalobrama amblycephala]
MKRIMMSDESSEEHSSEYILIPFFKMYGNISDSDVDPNSTDESTYKLVNGCPSYSDVRIRKSYVMSYNNKTKNAEWVYEILNKDTLKENCKAHGSFGRNEFEEKDYVQGHLAAAANHRWCQEAYHDTFLISNMVPQKKDLNNGDWKTIENYSREKAMNDEVCNVHVYSGPLYLKGKKNKEGTKVEDFYDHADLSTLERKGGKVTPTHFFKVIIVENKDGTVKEPECYVMPKVNTDDVAVEKFDKKNIVKIKHREYIKTIEKLSGLKFREETPPNVVTKDCIKTITGEGEKGESCSAKIKVRIS